MDILGILFILWAILTIFEVVVISSMKVSTFKYVKLLKFLEFFYVVLIITQINFIILSPHNIKYLEDYSKLIPLSNILILCQWRNIKNKL